MSEPQGLRSEREVTREQFGQFLRTVVKLFLLVFVFAALLSPPDPVTFTFVVVPGWIVAIPVAYYLVYRDGYAEMQASDAYRPGPLAGRTAVWFAGTALVLKIVLSLALGAVFTPGRAVGLFVSLFVLLVSYVLVYQGVYGMFVGE